MTQNLSFVICVKFFALMSVHALKRISHCRAGQTSLRKEIQSTGPFSQTPLPPMPLEQQTEPQYDCDNDQGDSATDSRFILQKTVEITE